MIFDVQVFGVTVVYLGLLYISVVALRRILSKSEVNDTKVPQKESQSISKSPKKKRKGK